MRVLLASLSMLFLVASGTADAPSDGQAADGVQGSANSREDDRSVALSPGQWDLTIEMNSVEAPGAPEAMLQEMRALLANHPRTQSQCITPEQARNPSRRMTGQNPGGCAFSETNWSGGNIRIRATCRPAEAPQILLSLDGSYTAQRIDSRLDMNMEMPDPSGEDRLLRIRIQGGLTGRRTGDCARGRGDPPGD